MSLFSTNDVTTLLADAKQHAKNAFTSEVNKTSERLRNAHVPGFTSKPGGKTITAATVKTTQSTDDWRLKISLPKNSDILYGDVLNDPLYLLRHTNGFIFPITPAVSVTESAKYSSDPLTHSNYPMNFYEGSDVSSLQISADFPVQSNAEGQYLLAGIYYFRSLTKMFFGGKTKYSGSPPPIVYLSGYGKYYFPNVPCVIKSFTHTMPADVDYISITDPKYYTPPSPTVSASDTRVPTYSQLQVEVMPMYSRNTMSKFNFEDFSSGQLLKQGFI